VGRVAVVVGGTKSEAYLRTKYTSETTPQTPAGDGKNLKRPAFISQSEMSPIGTLSFLVLIPG
jgi:hypothetical protein